MTLTKERGVYLGQAEKAEAIAHWEAALAEVPGYSDEQKNQQAFGGGGYPDMEVVTFVDAINAMDGICTIQSCYGHQQFTEDGVYATGFYDGQAWLRMNYPVTRAAEDLVRELVANPLIKRVTRMYGYHDATNVEEVWDILLEGRSDAAWQALVSWCARITG